MRPSVLWHLYFIFFHIFSCFPLCLSNINNKYRIYNFLILWIIVPGAFRSCISFKKSNKLIIIYNKKMILSLYIIRNQLTHSHDPVAHILGHYSTVNGIQSLSWYVSVISFFFHFMPHYTHLQQGEGDLWEVKAQVSSIFHTV